MECVLNLSHESAIFDSNLPKLKKPLNDIGGSLPLRLTFLPDTQFWSSLVDSFVDAWW